MFETHDSAELPIPPGLGDPGIRMWSYVVCRLFVPWIHVVRRVNHEEDGEPYALHETLFLTHVEQLLQLQGDPEVKIVTIDLVSPGHLNGSDRWKLEPLAEIWEGIEPGTDVQMAHVYVLKNGARYLDSGLASSESELRNLRRLLAFETGATTPGRKKNKP